MYVLDKDLQAGHKIDKWSERARIGIYLVQSPQHAKNVALVLSATTGLTSPQFHCKADPTFQTMRKRFGNHNIITAWQHSCHFLHGKSPVSARAMNRQVGELVNETISVSPTDKTQSADNYTQRASPELRKRWKLIHFFLEKQLSQRRKSFKPKETTQAN
jgi:hypothetical protein